MNKKKIFCKDCFYFRILNYPDAPKIRNCTLYAGSSFIIINKNNDCEGFRDKDFKGKKLKLTGNYYIKKSFLGNFIIFVQKGFVDELDNPIEDDFLFYQKATYEDLKKINIHKKTDNKWSSDNQIHYV